MKQTLDVATWTFCWRRSCRSRPEPEDLPDVEISTPELDTRPTESTDTFVHFTSFLPHDVTRCYAMRILNDCTVLSPVFHYLMLIHTFITATISCNSRFTFNFCQLQQQLIKCRSVQPSLFVSCKCEYMFLFLFHNITLIVTNAVHLVRPPKVYRTERHFVYNTFAVRQSVAWFVVRQVRLVIIIIIKSYTKYT